MRKFRGDLVKFREESLTTYFQVHELETEEGGGDPVGDIVNQIAVDIQGELVGLPGYRPQDQPSRSDIAQNDGEKQSPLRAGMEADVRGERIEQRDELRVLGDTLLRMGERM